MGDIALVALPISPAKNPAMSIGGVLGGWVDFLGKGLFFKEKIPCKDDKKMVMPSSRVSHTVGKNSNNRTPSTPPTTLAMIKGK